MRVARTFAPLPRRRAYRAGIFESARTAPLLPKLRRVTRDNSTPHLWSQLRPYQAHGVEWLAGSRARKISTAFSPTTWASAKRCRRSPSARGCAPPRRNHANPRRLPHQPRHQLAARSRALHAASAHARPHRPRPRRDVRPRAQARSPRHLLRHPAPRHRTLPPPRFLPRHPRRGAAHQESRQPERPGREGAPRAPSPHPHRHAAGKLGARSLVALRFSPARLPRHRGRFPRALRNAAHARRRAPRRWSACASACGRSSCAAPRRKCCTELPPKLEHSHALRTHRRTARSLPRRARAGPPRCLRAAPAKPGDGPRPHRRAHHAAAPAPGLLPSRPAAAGRRKRARGSEPSAKLDRTFELIDEAIDGGHRVLLFSQFVRMLHLLRDEAQRREIASATSTARPSSARPRSTASRTTPASRSSSSASRRAARASISPAPTPSSISIRGGIPPWRTRPPRARTASARRARVQAYKLIAAGTVEEKIQALQARKRELFDASVGRRSLRREPDRRRDGGVAGRLVAWLCSKDSSADAESNGDPRGLQ